MPQPKAFYCCPADKPHAIHVTDAGTVYFTSEKFRDEIIARAKAERITPRALVIKAVKAALGEGITPD
jgi:hypothetical protein